MVGALLAASSGGGAIVSIIYLAVIVFEIVALWKVFEKAGEPGWWAIIPIANVIITLKIIGRHWAWIFIALVPFVGGIILGIIIAIDLAKSFAKSGAFAVGLFFLGFIFVPILGFGDARYVGPAGKGGQGPSGGGYAGQVPPGQAYPGQSYPPPGQVPPGQVPPGQGYPPPAAPGGYPPPAPPAV
ncbi:MAG: DUF5684 domain-containing protein [Acidimicrobiales bacterium]|jgi:hypothetical protein